MTKVRQHYGVDLDPWRGSSHGGGGDGEGAGTACSAALDSAEPPNRKASV